ncbi:MAG: hypothetical protein CM15mV59_0010 [Caudoviricetes sp.]|nr:MAG: hypothetical protein CM15mV59_0010 [Caudoviricetes sp.]
MVKKLGDLITSEAERHLMGVLTYEPSGKPKSGQKDMLPLLGFHKTG